MFPRALVVVIILSLFTSSFAQSPKRKKLKDFGSSLDRLKSNQQKNPNTDLADEDVIRIDTSLVSTELLVLDKNGANVSGLNADDFTVIEDGKAQTLLRTRTMS